MALNPADLAINQILQTELSARETILAAQTEADTILLEARRQAAEINVQADRQITTIHRHRAKLLKEQVQELMRQPPVAATDLDAIADPDRLAQSVRRLAAILTGGETLPVNPS